MSRGMRLRPRSYRWRIAVGWAAAAAAAGAAALAKWPHAWPWLVPAMTGAAAMATAVSSRAGQQDLENASRTARGGLQAMTRASGDRPPIIGTIDLVARAHPAVTDLRYVERDKESEVRAYLRVGRPVLPLSKQEQGRLSQAVADPGVRERIRRAGIGEYVGGAARIDKNLKLGPSLPHAGYALVRGAADWPRMGMSKRVAAGLLQLLASPYIDPRTGPVPPDGQFYDNGLAWATRHINPTMSLLERTDKDMFAIDDRALDMISLTKQPIPGSSWELALQRASAQELMRFSQQQ